MRTAEADILIVPGCNGSGPDHWQSRWERKLATASRVEQTDWTSPDPDEWRANLIASARIARRPVVLVAHGLGAIAAAAAAPHLAGIVRGAFLVAPPDLGSSGAPPKYKAFELAPRERLPIPVFLVASRTDPHCSFASAKALAQDWGALLVDAGPSGHLDPDSGHGPWPEGLLLFSRLLRSIEA